MPAELASAAELQQRAVAVAKLGANGAELQIKLAQAQAEASTMRGFANEDDRALRDLRENIVASQFFNGLEPTCCPRCETKVASTKLKQESVTLSCSLCSEHIPIDEFEGASETIVEAEARMEASAKAAAHAELHAKGLLAQLTENQKAQQEAQASLDAALRSADFQKRRHAELEVARLEGAIRERQTPAAPVADDPDLKLVVAADLETQKAYEDGRSDILEALNAEILELARRLGVKALEQVTLNTNATLALTKGGMKDTFSKVTAGERLRLRLATAIALLRVGEARGVGRHPGLLIVDSPGAEEVSDVDFTALIGELQTIARETAGLQIFVASANPTAILSQLKAGRCRVALGDAYVW